MGDFVYALGGVTTTNLATMAQTVVVEFPMLIPPPVAEAASSSSSASAA
jgi:hypothetical protein